MRAEIGPINPGEQMHSLASCGPSTAGMRLATPGASGKPIWFWSPSSPVRGWVRSHHRGSAKLAFFCTMGHSGAAHAFGQLESVCDRPPTAALELTLSQLASGLDAALADVIAGSQCFAYQAFTAG